MQPHETHPSDQRDEPALPHQTVGSTLRSARLRLGGELTEIATVLRIRPAFLEAIEEGHFQALPGAPYAMGFVRTYAEHLGLDGAEMVRRFKSEAAGLERKTSLSFPSPAPEGRVPGNATLLISLVAVTVVFAGWYFYQSGTERLALRVPEVPERLAGPAGSVPAFNMGGLGDTPGGAAPTGPSSAAATPSPTGPAVPAPAAPAGAAPAPAPVGVEPALPPPPGDPTRRVATATSPALTPPPAATLPPPGEIEDSPPPDPTTLGAAPPGGAGDAAIPPVPQVAAAPSDGRVFGAQNADARVIIKARGESWVQIRDATNTPLLTRVLRPGDSYRVPNQAGLVMMTGNAGVLDVLVDGSAAPPLGAVGAVRRNIALDAERLRAGSTGAQ
jgi:hypothetical protein